MLYSFGNIVKIAPFINATMITAQLLSIISINLIPSKKLCANQNLLSLNFITNTANSTLPTINYGIVPLINPILSSISTIL